MNKFIICIAFLLVAFTDLYSIGTVRDDIDFDVDTLAFWMEGSFSSQLQSTQDTSYSDLRLEIRRIWPEKEGDFWMIVEQVLASSPESPVRQRVMQIRRVEENMIEIRMFAWINPDIVRGAWKDVSQLSSLTSKDLRMLRGCELYLQRDAIMFFGSTHGMACSGQVKGASYSTSDVKITSKMLALWDRDFAVDGTQVSGVRKGPYYFLRQNP